MIRAPAQNCHSDSLLFPKCRKSTLFHLCRVLCHNPLMRTLTATFCLTFAVFLGGVGLSLGADLQKGLEAYDRRDFNTAQREWEPLAEQGNARAQYFLGLVHNNVRSGKLDFRAAANWFRRAADQGLAEAQTNLGFMYVSGSGVKQDYQLAVRWFRLAAEQGFAKSQFLLGVMHQKGRGVPQDDEEAAKWYRLAAEREDVLAPGYLSAMYLFGKGVPKNITYALMWANIGASYDHTSDSPLRRALMEKMTSAQIAKANNLTRECVRKKLKGC